MRFVTTGLVPLALSIVLLSAPGAVAVTRFDIVETSTSRGHDADALEVGETITVGLRIAGGAHVYGLGASASGYDESVLDFESGRAVLAINHQFCHPHPLVGCSGTRLVSWPNGDSQSGELVESAVGGHGNRVLFYNGVGLSPTFENPLDPGLDGVVGGNDAQVRITFVATGAGTTTIRFGTVYPGDAELTPEANEEILTTFSVIVIPEPADALLLGIGLAGLASSPRRRSSD